MKFEKQELNLENGLKREWIITNGLGGYASSTIIGANTRRYHGLFVAPLNPPAKRYLMLSKLDESLEIKGKKYELFTNIGKNYISEGYKYLDSFSKEILPIFKYKVKDVTISKTICMVYRRNTVLVYYKIRNGKDRAKLILAPVINFRDFHGMNTNHEFSLSQQINSNKVKIVVDNNVSTPIYMYTTAGSYIEHHSDTFYNMFYIEEEKRGFYPEENHAVCGRFEVDLKPGEEKEVSFICSLDENIEETVPKYVIDSEIIRQNQLYNRSELIDNNNLNKTKKQEEEDNLKRIFLTAIDNFIVFRPTFALHTVIAGYPWFLDWGRDTLISFEGFSSLLLFEQIQKYVDYTGDFDFVKRTMYSKLKEIIENYSEGITFADNNIYLDEDGLIYSGNENTQNTWMDAKYDNYVATPRYGKVVEINAMWYNALMIMTNLAKKCGGIGKKLESKKYEKMAEKCRESFVKKFYNEKKKSLYDYLGNEEIRPNQLFALSLAYPVLNPNSEIAYNIIDTVEKKLLNSYGLRTLAKGEENYVDIYEGDCFKRDMSYHQGPTWPWLLGLYYDALMNMKLAESDSTKKKQLEEKITKFKERTYRTFKKEINQRGCIGSISELYDSKTPFEPKGAFAQAWSVAEVFRIIF